jgi:trimeric autotransporter adhesin
MKKMLLLMSLVILSVSCGHEDLIVESTIGDGLVAWYPFNGNTNDESGNLNDGSNMGAELTANRLGKSNSAYSFTNSSSTNQKRIDISMNTTSVTNGLSIVWWIKRNGNGAYSPRAFEFWSGSESEGKFVSGIRNDENTLWFDHHLAGESISFTLPYSTSNGWVHYVYTVGNGEARIYVNGKLQDKQIINTTSIKLGNKVALGRMNHPSYDAFNGILDDVAVYNRVITQDEINHYYNYQD